MSRESNSTEAEEKYLSLLKRMLCRFDFEGEGTWVPVGYTGGYRLVGRVLHWLFFGPPARVLPRRYRLAQFRPFRAEIRREGLDWPFHAETMVGLERLNNVHELLSQVEENQIPGDFLEAGVWRGGVGIFVSAFYQTKAISRRVFLCDSFAGLPRPSLEYSADARDNFHRVDYLKVSVEEVRANFERYGIPTQGVTFVKGFFSESLPKMTKSPISILRLDGDMYESTIQVLENLFDSVSAGGFVIVDDWGLQAREAVEDFCKGRALSPEMIPIDSSSVYFRK